MKAFLVAAACGIVLALTGCSGEFSGTARGLFLGYVTDKTEEEVVAKAVVETVNPNTQRWTYKKKTFDPDNQSKFDDETILILQKDASGKFKVTQVIFG